jgi:hypothetical protein
MPTEMPTKEQLKEWQEQQDRVKDNLKAQIDRSLVTSVEFHYDEDDLGNGLKRVLKTDEWEITIRGVWQDKQT